MARRRLTTFSKFLITLLVVGGATYGFIALRDNGTLSDIGIDVPTTNEGGGGATHKKGKDDGVIDIGVVTWGGYAAGQYFNEGFDVNPNSRFTKDYGLKVNFEIVDDFVASRKMFEKGELDLLWATVDAFPTESGTLGGDPQIVFQADWSRGGDAIVARRGINSVEDLRGKTIAVAELTPSHSFLIWLLKAGGLTEGDVKLEKFPDAIAAAGAFKARQVDAAVVWSPDDEACVRAVSGAKILQNTKSASNIIADVFLARKDYIEGHQEELEKLYEGWMIGAAELNASDANKRKAAKILADNFEGFIEDDAYQAIENVRLCTHGDNLNFFGLNRDFKGVTGENLYSNMETEYSKLGYIEGNAPSWRLVSRSEFVNSASLSGQEHAAEGAKEFVKVTNETEAREKKAIATKRLSIKFDSGSYELEDNAMTLLDMNFVDIAKSFSNAQIRIVGNTDNVGNRTSNIALSKKRAQAVADYLVNEHGMPASRFIVLGNGPDNPVPGCEGSGSAECNSKNRRTDLEIVQ